MSDYTGHVEQQIRTDSIEPRNFELGNHTGVGTKERHERTNHEVLGMDNHIPFSVNGGLNVC